MESLRAGAHGYLLKDAAATELRGAIRAVRRGESFFSPAIAGRLGAVLRGEPGEPRSPALAQLSARERQVLVGSRPGTDQPRDRARAGHQPPHRGDPPGKPDAQARRAHRGRAHPARARGGTDRTLRVYFPHESREDRNRDDEPGRAGRSDPGGALPAGAVRRPRDHPAPVPGLAGTVHRPPADPQGAGPLPQHRRRLPDPALHRGAGPRDGRAARPALPGDRTARILRRLPLRHAQERGRASRHGGGRRRAGGRVHPVSPVLLRHHGLEPQRALARRGAAPGWSTRSAGA